MKILHAIPYFLPAKAFGGPVWSTYHLCRELVKRGHEITLFTTNILGPNETQKEFLNNEVIDGITVKRSRIRARFMSYYFTPDLIRHLISESADVIHAHGYRNFQTDASALCSKAKKIPFILQPRGMGISEAAIERGSRSGNLIYKAYDLFTMRSSLKVADRVIATTKFEKDLLDLNLKGKTEVIPHGVDAGTFRRDEQLGAEFRAAHDIDGDVILYVGRLDKGKNIEALFNAAGSLQGASTIVIAGEEVASTQLQAGSIKNELVGRAKKLNLKVAFTGSLYGRDLTAAYSAADIFVNPSVSRAENFGLVNMEAAACSLPVVAAPVGVAPELLEKHEWLLFDSEDGLANTLIRLLEDETLRRKVGSELRKKVEKEYTWERVVDKIEDIYNELTDLTY